MMMSNVVDFPCLKCERVFEIASADWHCRIVDGTEPAAGDD
jgi:hypothetical protein